MSKLFKKGYEYEKQGDYANALSIYLQEAELGNDEAECSIGNIYRFGRGYPKDYEKALYWYHRSAERGNSYAESNIGSMYRFGQGVEKNYSLALEWYLKSAEKDNDYAAQNIGSMYRFGEGVDVDYRKALEWYLKAAEKENKFAQSNIGCMYRFGEGVDQDYRQAFHWYSLAAQQGYVYAKYELGVLYYHGHGIEHDGNKAFSLLTEYERDTWLDFKKNGEAYYYLGECHKNGVGTSQNFVEAEKCYQKAIELGFNCQYALSIVQNEIDESAEQNLMREYADKILHGKVPTNELYTKVSKDLSRDFGELWSLLTTESQRFLITAMVTYVSFYSMGGQIYGNLDFSSVITQMFKALERELGRYLYVDYLNYLRFNEIDPNTFRRKRSFIKRVSKNTLEYKDASDLSEFTLGSLNLTIGYDRASGDAKGAYNKADGLKGQIDRTMYDYLKSIFKSELFTRSNIECEITDYMISVYQEVKSIADSLRNPAAHSEIMKCKRAEVCGNYLIKVKKLLIHFLDKLKK